MPALCYNLRDAAVFAMQAYDPCTHPPPLFVLFFIQKVRPNEFLIRAKFKTQQLPNNLGSPGKQFHASIRCRAGGHVFVRIVAGFL